MTKAIPDHILAANAALKLFKDHESYNDLKKLLPSLASRRYQRGELIDAAALIDAANKGTEHVKSEIKRFTKHNNHSKTYQEILESTYADNPDEADIFNDDQGQDQGIVYPGIE